MLKNNFEIYKLNINNYELIDIIDFIGGITRGEYRLKENNNRTEEQKKKLLNRLKKESAGQPSSVFEFIPVIIDYENEILKLKECIGEDNFINNFLRYSYVNGNTYYTNYRTILKIEQKYDYQFMYLNMDWKNDKRFNDFVIIYGEIPFKVISHLVRHRKFSFIVQTSRIKKYYPDIYIPKEFENLNLKFEFDESIEQIFNIVQFFKNNGIKNEISNMFLPQFRMVKFAMSAWKNDKDTFENLFNVRQLNQGTMNITNQVVVEIKKLIENE